jgi:hypothetical protein
MSSRQRFEYPYRIYRSGRRDPFMPAPTILGLPLEYSADNDVYLFV